MRNIVIIISLLAIWFYSCEPLDLKRVIDTRTDDIEIIGTSVTAYGTILDVGDKSILDHGHCWSFSPNPTIDDMHTNLGVKAETGNFSSELHDLIPGRTIYIRSYVYNGEDYVYGEETDFEITAENLEFSTQEIDELKNGEIVVSSSTNGIGSIDFSSHGHCWSQTDPPTIDDRVESYGPYINDTTYSSAINSLNLGVYYIRGYLESEGFILYTNSVRYESTISTETGMISLNHDNSIIAYGKITSLGGKPITDHGHCWSTFTSSPSLNDDYISLGSSDALESYESDIVDLISGREYFIRAYATDGSKVYYGEIKSFVSN